MSCSLRSISCALRANSCSLLVIASCLVASPLRRATSWAFFTANSGSSTAGKGGAAGTEALEAIAPTPEGGSFEAAPAPPTRSGGSAETGVGVPSIEGSTPFGRPALGLGSWPGRNAVNSGAESGAFGATNLISDSWSASLAPAAIIGAGSSSSTSSVLFRKKLAPNQAPTAPATKRRAARASLLRPLLGSGG